MPKSNKPKLMMHIVAGYPTMHGSERIAQQILESGADFLEIQIPFSDPVADGPIIALANEVSLKQGTCVEDCMSMINRVAKSTEKLIFIMTYFNVVHRYGIPEFCKKAKAMGVQGLIVPDYPFDEKAGNELLKHCRKNTLDFIQVIASTTRKERMRQIVKSTTGFVYCMARTGITGKQTTISPKTIDYLKTVKSHCPLPLAVGFGLSQKAQIEALSPYTDIVVVGSALIKAYTNKPIKEALTAVGDFIHRLLD